eukprot:g27651.t1
MKVAEPARLLEEDADQENTLESLDSRNIIEGKRRRNKVDYVALEKQLDEEERQHQDRRPEPREDVFSDDSSSSAGTGKIQKIKKPHREDSTEMTPKEWSEHHAAQCKKEWPKQGEPDWAAHLFRKWMLGTSTPRHEEILRRKSKLQVRFPVSLIGPGRRMLEQELSPYGVTLPDARGTGECCSSGGGGQRSVHDENRRRRWRTGGKLSAAREEAPAPKSGHLRR